jgi:putative transposase
MTQPSAFKWFKTRPEINRMAMQDWGYTAILPFLGALPDEHINYQHLYISIDRTAGTCTLPWGVTMPLDPFFGVMSVAPPCAWGRIGSPRGHCQSISAGTVRGTLLAAGQGGWRAVDHEREVLESFVTKTRDKKAALKFLKKAMKKHGRCEQFVTDKLRSYGAAMKDLGVEDRQETGRWLNNRGENSHLPFRRRERAMLRFRRMRSLQKFASVHASVTNHFNSERSLSSRDASSRPSAPPLSPSVTARHK